MGAIQTQKQENMRQQKILVNKEPITFKTDSGAAAMAIPASTYSAEKQGKLKDSKKMILGPKCTPLKVQHMPAKGQKENPAGYICCNGFSDAAAGIACNPKLTVTATGSQLT